MSSSSLSDTAGAPAGLADRRTGRVPVTVVFFVLGAVSASWAARLPAIRAPLHLSPEALGLALLGPAVGAVVAMPATGAVLARLPPRPVVAAALVPLCAFVPLVTVASGAWQLFAVLFGWGLSVGVVDVGMNLEAVGVQDRLERRVMSRFHASYSIGGLAGAGVGAACASAGVAARDQLAAVSAVVLAAGLPAAAAFRRGGRVAARPRHRRQRLQLTWPLVALAAMAFGSFLAEGAANDWSAVYLRSSLGASAGLAALGYTSFAGAMTLGRLFGDHLAERIGPARLVRASAAAGAAGLGAALAIGTAPAALVGLVLLGFGLSSVVPNAFLQASRLGRAGPSLAVVTSCGYGGMLAGPPAIGGLAGRVGLTAALGTVAGFAALVAVLAGVLPSRPGPRPATPP